MLKITIQYDQYFHTLDYATMDTMDGLEKDEYFPSVKECLNDVLDLLSGVYSKEDIAVSILDGKLPVLDYGKPGYMRKKAENLIEKADEIEKESQ